MMLRSWGCRQLQLFTSRACACLIVVAGIEFAYYLLPGRNPQLRHCDRKQTIWLYAHRGIGLKPIVAWRYRPIASVEISNVSELSRETPCQRLRGSQGNL